MPIHCTTDKELRGYCISIVRMLLSVLVQENKVYNAPLLLPRAEVSRIRLPERSNFLPDAKRFYGTQGSAIPKNDEKVWQAPYRVSRRS